MSDDETFLMAYTEAQRNDNELHVLVFRSPIEVGSWDVAYCGASLGDYVPVDFGVNGVALSSICASCIEGFGASMGTRA